MAAFLEHYAAHVADGSVPFPGAVETRGTALRLRNVRIYERTGGVLSSILSADSASPVAGTAANGWELTNS